MKPTKKRTGLKEREDAGAAKPKPAQRSDPRKTTATKGKTEKTVTANALPRSAMSRGVVGEIDRRDRRPASIAPRAMASPPVSPQVDPVRAALLQLEQLRRDAQKQLDQSSDGNLRETLNDLLDLISDAITALNQQGIEEHTVSLQAAAAELDPAIGELERLRDELASIATTIAEVAKIADAVDSVISGFKQVVASFGA